MRVLTVMQPWAWAIFHGKGIENRTTAWGYRGPLAIHAGTRVSERGFHFQPLKEAVWRAMPEPVTWHKGAILGTVDLVDVHTAHPNRGCCDSPWAETSYHEHGGRTRRDIVHLVLANPVEFAEPIRNVRGRLGLWTPDPDLAEAIGAAA